jgi:uncharacterized protein
MINPTLLPAGLPADRIGACIGLISDTHMPQRWPSLPAAVTTVFQGVDLILHAGDVGELWVLDQLSALAPVIAVHGNDDSQDAQRELPYQQVLTVAGQRLLLWHSHFPDRIDELNSRRHDELAPQFERSLERARRCGAQMVIFGHWHIPLVYRAADIQVINPGAIASGNPFLRQVRQTVALLFLGDDGTAAVSHVDLAQPGQIYQPAIDFSAGFNAVSQAFSTSMLAPELAGRERQLFQQMHVLGFDAALPPLLRVAHRCWAGEQPLLTRAAWLAEIAADPDLSAERKARYVALLHKASESVGQ